MPYYLSIRKPNGTKDITLFATSDAEAIAKAADAIKEHADYWHAELLIGETGGLRTVKNW